MTHIHFTLETKELIQKSIQDDISNNILQTVFNQLMKINMANEIFDTPAERENISEAMVISRLKIL